MVLEANYVEMFRGGMEVHLESFEAFTKYKSTFLSKNFHCGLSYNHCMGYSYVVPWLLYSCPFFILAEQRRDSRGVGPTAENSLLKIFSLQCISLATCWDYLLYKYEFMLSGVLYRWNLHIITLYVKCLIIIQDLITSIMVQVPLHLGWYLGSGCCNFHLHCSM